ncbi:helix-turn-helix transcriptional regulator [uncultured Clostridium sp.]|uniref:helix-turn-helix transcriptional regulator n=1 Tax=uncultured Clostridium sp. TaxID=59620 RepID=UPI00272F30FF|nr:helix-turn-helix domain-containing protein [uncultured Clostridium sp.]
MKTFLANNLKNLRIDNDYSQQQIADALKVSRSRYSNYENGTSEPPIEILIQISNFFKCSVDDLIKIKIDSTIVKEPKLSINLNEFNYSDLKKSLLKNKNFYEEKRKTILNEIDSKIEEIDILLDFINDCYSDKSHEP